MKFVTSKKNPIVIYTDGSDIKGTGKLGYGIWFEYMGKEYKISGVEDAEIFKIRYGIENSVSNPTMEMKALVECLKVFQGQSIHLLIKSDYEGVQKWLNGSWKTKEPYIRDLVKQAYDYIKGIEHSGGSVKLDWVKGHQTKSQYETEWEKKDRIGNTKVDKIAKDRKVYNTITNELPEQENPLKINLYQEPSTIKFPKPFLEEYFFKMKNFLAEHKIEIEEVQHHNFLEKYKCRKGDQVTWLDIFYNAKNQITKKVPGSSGQNSKELTDEISDLFLFNTDV
ncbi:MAG TPA: RNase H family protein [Ignavibacteriaceae bacterium]|nr:RNase H family protein [Ignavibacteriaceae bacterium]